MMFSVRDPFYDNTDYKETTLSERDYDLIDSVSQDILKFAVFENMILSSVDQNQNKLLLVPGDLESWRWKTVTEDFRSFVYSKNLYSYLETLKNSPENILSKIINLHFRLCSSYEERILNIIVDRIYSAIQIIPYISPEDLESEEMLEWSEIHIQNPWLWVCILLQNVLKNEVYKMDGE